MESMGHGIGERKALQLQPQQYQIYIKNLVHTVSRSLGQVDDVIVGSEYDILEHENVSSPKTDKKFIINDV